VEQQLDELVVRGLLHRIASVEPNRPLDPVESILAHLRAILNTERGDGHTHPDLGVCLQGLLIRWPASRAEVLREIRTVIETYEPRLTDVRVDTIPGDAHRLAVVIHARLADETLRIRTDLAPMGHVGVRQVHEANA
jgi:type VI secretion system lysozyme-like protein